MCSGLRQPLVDHFEQILIHNPHENIQTSAATVAVAYEAGC